MNVLSRKNPGYALKMHCKYCGHVQSKDLAICEVCGMDMGLYGETVKIMADKQEREKRRRVKTASGEKKQDNNEMFVFLKRIIRKIGLGLLCAVVILIAAGILLPSDDPEVPAETTPAVTVPAVTEPETVPTQPEIPELPDFLAFSNGMVEENKVEQFDSRYSYCYTAAQDVRPMFDEYQTVLTSGYPYTPITTSHLTNDWEGDYYWYRYTGSAPVTDQTITVDEKQGPIEGYHVWTVYLKNQKNGNVCIYVGASNEISYQDNGERASVILPPANVEPIPKDVTVTDLTLNCYDLMYDSHNFELIDWVPVGYEIGYDLQVAYTGQKTSEFNALVTSSDENVLRVDSRNCRIEAVGAGTATVTASLGGKTSSQQITVYPVDSSSGSTLQIEPSVIEVSGTAPVEVPVKISMTFGADVEVMTTKYLVDPSVISHQASGGWKKIADKTYIYEMKFTVDPQKLYDDTNKGILFYMICKDGDDSYDLDRDIFGFTVAEIVKK